jgi:AraC-like DNA-binding protein
MDPSFAIEPSGVRNFKLFESYDVDETRDRISQVLKPHSLTPTREPGRRKARMNLAGFKGISLTTIDFGAGMYVDATGSSDYHSIILCVRGRADARFDGEAMELGAARGVIGEPGWRLAAKFSSDCEQFLIRVDAKSVTAHTGLKPRFRRLIDLTDPKLQPWLQQLRALATSVEMLECLQRSELAADSMERLLIALLMAGQPWVDTSAEDTRCIAPHCVRKAEAFIQNNAAKAIRLADIAAAAGVPTRTLHDGFRRFRDYSPIEYLATVRLDWARQRLARADDATLVVHVALDCGFAHLGRFASAYRKRFGESPSATLRRAAAR